MFYPVVDLTYQLTEGFAARFIRYKVARLIHRDSIDRADRDDLEQELKLHLVRRSAKFDPAVAHWNAFVVMVIERQLLTILISRRRHCHRFASLDEIAFANDSEDDDSSAMAPCKHKSDYDFHNAMERIDLALDVQGVLTRLSEPTQRLCERLMNDSPAEVARQMQLPRTTLHGHILRLRNRFQTFFEKSKNSPSLCRESQ